MTKELISTSVASLRAEEAQLMDYMDTHFNIDIIACCRRLLTIRNRISQLEADGYIDCSQGTKGIA